ncbi:MAG: response regulator [Actinomycetota bacterium]
MTWVRRILVVEDEPFVRGLVGETLRGAGFEVRTAGTATEAMEQVEDFDPDGAVLDIDLGDGPNGVDVSDALSVRAMD